MNMYLRMTFTTNYYVCSSIALIQYMIITIFTSYYDRTQLTDCWAAGKKINKITTAACYKFVHSNSPKWKMEPFEVGLRHPHNSPPTLNPKKRENLTHKDDPEVTKKGNSDIFRKNMVTNNCSFSAVIHETPHIFLEALLGDQTNPSNKNLYQEVRRRAHCFNHMVKSQTTIRESSVNSS